MSCCVNPLSILSSSKADPLWKAYLFFIFLYTIPSSYSWTLTLHVLLTPYLCSLDITYPWLLHSLSYTLMTLDITQSSFLYSQCFSFQCDCADQSESIWSAFLPLMEMREKSRNLKSPDSWSGCRGADSLANPEVSTAGTEEIGKVSSAHL